MSSNNSSKFEFLSAKVISNPFKQTRSKGGFRYPEYTDEPFEDPALQERERRGVEYQLRETTEILSQKLLKEENEVFLKVYTKANPSEMEVKSLLDALKANVVAYVDRKQHGMLISGSMQKLEQLSNKDTPKYLTEKVRIIKSLTKEDQIQDEIDNMSGIKMLIFSIIPNLDTIKNKIYINILQNFFSNNNCKMYRDEFQKFGFILADVTSEIINELIQKSTFIFKINLIPDGVAEEIRESSSESNSENLNNFHTPSNPYLPKVVLMDSGVNDLPSLRPVISERNSYLFQNMDDEHDGNGHGTPIANLIAFGETSKSPSANIISYKIWSSAERSFASRGLIRGIEEYADKTRLFVTSIGIPQMPPHFMVMLDRLIQSKNVCLVASGGNLDFPEIKDCLKQGGTYPDIKVDVIEIDPGVVEAARTYFDLQDDPRMNIFVDDARKHLATFDKKYDVVVLDAYSANYVPYHLMTDEFFEILEERMEPDGVVVSNVIGSIEGQHSHLARAIYKTMKETFPVAYVFPTENIPTNIQNLMMVSSNNPYEFDRVTLLELAKNSPADYLVDELSKQNHFYKGTINTSDVPFLTDQLNPSEVLTNPLTNRSYMQESQDKQIEKKEHRNDSINLGIGIALSVIAFVWLVYFKKKILN